MPRAPAAPWALRFAPPLLALAASLAAAYYVQRPYRTAGFTLDDFLWLNRIGLLSLGNSGLNWFTFLFFGDGEHACPLWKLMYCGIWRIAGFVPEHFRHANTVLHALSAWLAFLLVQRQVASTWAALFGAALWASNASVGWDSPLLWTSCACYPLSLTFFLGAMLFLQRALQPSASRTWAWLMAVCAIATVFTWNTLVVWLPLLPLQAALFKQRELGFDALARQRWFWIWSGAFGLVVLGTVARQLIYPSLDHGVLALSSVRSELELIGYSVSKVFLFAGMKPLDLYAAALILAVFTVLLAFVPRAHRRLAILLLLLGMAQGALVALFRPGRDMNAARYLYYPSFGLCFSFAVVFDGLLVNRDRRLRLGLYVGAVVLIAVVAQGQVQHAKEAKSVADVADADDMASVASYNRFLHEVAERARLQGRRIRVADVPCVLLGRMVESETYFPLRGYARVAAPECLRDLMLVPPDELTLEDIQSTLAAVSSSPEIAARLIHSTLSHVLLDLTSLAWLSRICQQEGRDLVVPNVVFYYSTPKLTFTLRDCSHFAFSRPLPRITISPGPLTSEQKAALRSLLRRYPTDDSALLERRFRLDP